MEPSLSEMEQKLRLRKLWLACGYLFAASIIFFSLSSIVPKMHVRNFDKILHISSYFLLMLWWLQLYQHRITRLLLAIAFILMGAGIEYGQSFHPLRYFDVKDMIANAAGVTSACILNFFIRQNLLIKIENVFLKQ